MPHLEDLKKNLLTMDMEEFRAKIRAIREDRIIRKEAKSTKVRKVKEKEKTRGTASKLLDGMTPEEIKALLDTLE